MNLDHVIARRFEPIHQTYDWRDSALYALGLGIGDQADIVIERAASFADVGGDIFKAGVLETIAGKDFSCGNE